MSFFDKLEAAIVRNNSLLFVGLDPNPELLPAKYHQGSDTLASLEAWLQFVILQTANLVCAYKPTLGFYQALGAPGLELLERILAVIPPHIPVILDAKQGDLNTATLFAQTAFEHWRVDGVTVSPLAGQDQVLPYLLHPGKAVFVLCCTSNPAATGLQNHAGAEFPLYLQIAKEAKTWGTPEQLGLEVGTTRPEVLARVRSIAPERILLARSIWATSSGTPFPSIQDFDSEHLQRMLTAGLNSNGEGLLIPIPQDFLCLDAPTSAIEPLQQTINQTRHQVAQAEPVCNLLPSNTGVLQFHPRADLILQLFDVGCLLFGEYVQASGAVFPYYIDLRKIISNPQVFHQVLNAYVGILKDLQFDRIAGIPYGSLPTATGLALRLNHPLVFPRKEVKAHGTRKLVEGTFHPGETVVVVDDILISGKSAMEGAEKLKSVGLTVHDIVVFLDHGQGVQERLRQNGYRAHSVLTLWEIATTLYEARRITAEQLAGFTPEDKPVDLEAG